MTSPFGLISTELRAIRLESRFAGRIAGPTSLTDGQTVRLTGMERTRNKRGWRLAAMAVALVFAAVSLHAMAKPSVRRPVVQFIHFYEQSQSADTQDMSLWERVMYSVLMTETSSST
jgi:hypothetical protein